MWGHCTRVFSRFQYVLILESTTFIRIGYKKIPPTRVHSGSRNNSASNTLDEIMKQEDGKGAEAVMSQRTVGM